MLRPLPRARAGLRVALGLSALLALVACGREAPPAPPGQGEAHAATGRWTLDREALLESVRRRFTPEGRETVAREEAQAERVALELELRGDGAFGLLVTALGTQQHIVGRWRAEGRTLRFFRHTVDGKPVDTETVEEATFDAERISLPFKESGLSFTLMRR